MNHSNFSVHEVGRGNVLKCSLEIAEVLREDGKRWWKKDRKSLSRLSSNEVKLAMDMTCHG